MEAPALAAPSGTDLTERLPPKAVLAGEIVPFDLASALDSHSRNSNITLKSIFFKKSNPTGRGPGPWGSRGLGEVLRAVYGKGQEYQRGHSRQPAEKRGCTPRPPNFTSGETEAVDRKSCSLTH